MRKVLQKTEKNVRKNEQGIALITAIFSILLATVIGFALYYSSSIAFTIAANERDNTEAFYLADAGINHALALIGKVPKSKASAILTGGANATPNTGDELSAPPTISLWRAAESIPAGNATSGGVVNFGANGAGRYWVSVKNDTAAGEGSTTDLNGILVVTSTGVGRDGATATIEVVVTMKPFPAVLINSKADVTGSLDVKGAGGIMHANDTFRLSGSPCADLYFSASGSITNPNLLRGAGCNGTGVSREYQKIIPPPIYNIRTDFYDKADYILGAIGSKAGRIYDRSGFMVYKASGSRNSWDVGQSSWSWDSVTMTWSHSGNEIQSATFYSEGNIELGGSLGTKTIPVRVTLFAEGYISNQGKQYIAPAYSVYSLVAGTDLKLKGNFNESTDLNVQGINYALQQISFGGSVSLAGIVIAANQGDANSPGCGCNPVPLNNGYMDIAGSPDVTNDGDYLGGGADVNSWREVRY